VDLPLTASIDDILEQGLLPGLTGVTISNRSVAFKRLWDLTAKHDVEFALTHELIDGKSVYRLYSGERGFVEYPTTNLIRRIAHTHPSGNAAISEADVANHNRAWLRYFERNGRKPYTPQFPSRVVYGPGVRDYTMFWPSILR
jgi:hypothetical protein